MNNNNEKRCNMWPFNYPGDEYVTNVFSQIIIILEDIKESAVEMVDNIKEEIKNE